MNQIASSSNWDVLGVAELQKGDHLAAVRLLSRAIQADERNAIAWENLGTALRGLGKLPAAINAYQQAIALAAQSPSLFNNLGAAFLEQRRFTEAVGYFCQALHQDPNYADARFNLGLALKELGRNEEALEQLRWAVTLQPTFHEAHNILGAVLHSQGKLAEAVQAFQQSIAVQPNYADAYNNLGASLQILGHLEDAATGFRKAIELRPDYRDAHINLAQLLLLTGDFARGWSEYEWRWKGQSHFANGLPSTAVSWQGERLEGKSIVVFAEQGHGDTLHFARYLQDLKQRGATVFFAVPAAMHKLFKSFPWADHLLDRIPVGFYCDYYAPLLSLPGICGTNLDNIPSQVPYLWPDASLVETWRQRLKPFGHRTIGIVWQGNPRFGSDRWRSVPLTEFAPLAQVPGVTLIALQKGAGLEQLAAAQRLFPIATIDSLDDESGAFMDTVAVMKNLSLIVTSDTSIVHLAGAIGVPTWMATSAACDWRWLLDRTDSPWYPTLRLFRQTELGNWKPVFEAMAQALAKSI